jgi:hypothetical protein
MKRRLKANKIAMKRLKIRNLSVIDQHHIDHDTWRVDGYGESYNEYTFYIRNAFGRTVEVRLSRTGSIGSDGDHRYNFIRDKGILHQVTPRYFGDIKNALRSIRSELKYILEE